MIYHAGLAHLSNHTTLNSAYHKALKNNVVLATKTIVDNGNEVLLKDHPLGQRAIALQKETVNSLFVGIQKKTYFINSLRELVSPAAVEFIEVFQEQNRNTVSTYMTQLKYSLGKASDLQMESITSPETLFKILQPQKLTELDPNTNEGKAEMLYHYSNTVLDLTTAGNRLYANDNVLSLRELVGDQGRIIDLLSFREEINSVAQSSSIADTTKSFGGFNSKSAYDLFLLLTGQDKLLTETDPKLAESTARLLITEGNFQTLEEVKTSIDEARYSKGTLHLKGIGPGKFSRLVNVVSTAVERQDDKGGVIRSPSSSNLLTASTNRSQTSKPSSKNLLTASTNRSQTSKPSTFSRTESAPLLLEDK